jgi:hypothetical protein
LAVPRLSFHIFLSHKFSTTIFLCEIATTTVSRYTTSQSLQIQYYQVSSPSVSVFPALDQYCYHLVGKRLPRYTPTHFSKLSKLRGATALKMNLFAINLCRHPAIPALYSLERQLYEHDSSIIVDKGGEYLKTDIDYRFLEIITFFSIIIKHSLFDFCYYTFPAFR